MNKITEQNRKGAKIKELHSEYVTLKEKIFGKDKFVIAEDTTEQKRYDQLFQYFHPEFRTQDFINPAQTEN